MNVKMNDLVEVLQKVYSESTTYVSWDGNTQWMLETARQRMKKYRAMHYDNLRTLNEISGVARRANDRSQLKKHLRTLVKTGRETEKKLIENDNRQIREHNIAYWIVTSSMLLEKELFCWSADSEPPSMLLNKKKRWYSTERMGEAYAKVVKLEASHRCLDSSAAGMSMTLYDQNMVQYAPEGGFSEYRIYGRAVIYLGVNKANVPVFISVDCDFDLAGNIYGIPEDFGWRVLMFRPYRKTVTTDFRNSRQSDT